MAKMNKIRTIIKKALLTIKRVGRVIVDALRPNYSNWMPPADEGTSILGNSSLSPVKENNPQSADTLPVEMEAKNKEIAELKAKLVAAEKEIKETKPFKEAYSKIKDTLNIEPSRGTYAARGRPSKNRIKKTVKIDTTIKIVYEYAKEIGLLDEDFSSFVNSALHDYMSGKYPTAYSIYERALEEVEENNKHNI